MAVKELSKRQIDRAEQVLQALVRAEFGVQVLPGALERLDADDRGEILEMLGAIEAAAQPRSARATPLSAGAAEFITKVEQAGAKAPGSDVVQRTGEIAIAYARQEGRVPNKAELKAISQEAKKGAADLTAIMGTLHALSGPRPSAAMPWTTAVLGQEDRLRFETLVERTCGLEEGLFAGRREIAKQAQDLKEMLAEPVLVPAQVFHDLSKGRLAIGDLLALVSVLGALATRELGSDGRMRIDGDTLVTVANPWSSWSFGSSQIFFPPNGDKRHPLNRLTRAGWLEATPGPTSYGWTIRKGPKLLEVGK